MLLVTLLLCGVAELMYLVFLQNSSGYYQSLFVLRPKKDFSLRVLVCFKTLSLQSYYVIVGSTSLLKGG